ncbi:MAG: hypothetical protein ACKVY0_11185 [Prosthecobacter sp.]|uniref:hypothetical protein n=1 Tax=Prosthecobacter sp. TaxID=1965333 RepID=UPI0039025112
MTKEGHSWLPSVSHTEDAIGDGRLAAAFLPVIQKSGQFISLQVLQEFYPAFLTLSRESETA